MITYSRQLDLFEPSIIGETPIQIIGGGGIGSFTALALAKLGMSNITIWDYDLVEPHNIPNQLFRVSDIGQPKVNAIKEIVKTFTDIDIKTVECKFEGNFEDLEPNTIVIAAVDNMETRKLIFESVKDHLLIDLLIDPRMGGLTARIFTIPTKDQSLKSVYAQKYLYSDEEAANIPCTASAIIDMAFIIASLITGIVRNYLKSSTIIHEIVYDGFNMNIIQCNICSLYILE